MIPTLFFEEAIGFHDFIVERYRYLYQKFKNPAHVWSCINDLAAISSTYFYMTEMEKDELFLKPLPECILEYIALSAIKLYTLVHNAQVAAEQRPKSPPTKTGSKNDATTDQPKKTVKTPTQLEKSKFSSEVMAKIPRAFALAKQGQNQILKARHQRQDFFDVRKYLLAGLPAKATAEILKMRRRQDLMLNPEDIAHGDSLAELQRYEQKARIYYEAWDIKILRPSSESELKARRTKQDTNR